MKVRRFLWSIFILSFFLGFCVNAHAVLSSEISLSPTSVANGEDSTLTVNVLGDENYGLLDLRIKYDPAFLAFKELSNKITNVTVDTATPGEITIDYFSVFDDPAEGLPPGKVVDIVFTAQQITNSTVIEGNGATGVDDDWAIQDVPPDLSTPPNSFNGLYVDQILEITSGPDITDPVISNVTVDGNPSPTTVNGDGAGITLSATVTDDNSVGSVTYSINGGTAQPMTYDSGTDTATADIKAGLLALGAGTYDIVIEATDGSGNTADTSATPFQVTLEGGIPAKILFDVTSRTLNTNGTDFIEVSAFVADTNNIPLGADSPAGTVTFTIDDETYAFLPDNGDGTATETVTLVDGATPEPLIQIVSKDVDVGTPPNFQVQASGTLDGPLNLDGFDRQNPSTGFIEITPQDRALVSIDAIQPQTPEAKVGGDPIPFTVVGNFDEGDPEDATELVTWTITSGDTFGTLSDAPGTKGVFTPVAAGEVTIQADPGIAGEEKTLQFTVAEAAKLVLFSADGLNSCTALPTILPNETFDLSTAVEGGVPDPVSGYSFEVDGTPLADSNFTPTLAGTYQITVSDSQATPDTATCSVTVPLVLTPQTFTIRSSTPTTPQTRDFTIDGASVGATFTIESSTDGGQTFSAFDTALGSFANLTYTAPVSAAAGPFYLRFTDDNSGVSAIAGPYEVIATQEFTGIVRDASNADDATNQIGGATVVLTNTSDQQTSDATTGEFTFPGLVATGKTFTFFVSAPGFISETKSYTTWDPATPEVFALTPVAADDGTLSGTVILEGNTPPFTGTDAIKVEITGDGTFSKVVYANNSGDYTAVIPAANTAETFSVRATKNGYFNKDIAPTSGLTTGLLLDTGTPPTNTTGDVTLKPITRIGVSVFQPVPALPPDLLISSVTPGFDFEGTPTTEFAVFEGTSIAGTDVTSEYLPWDNLATASYGKTLDPAPATLQLFIQADVTDDRDVSSDPHVATRLVCITPTAELTTDQISNPNANGGEVPLTNPVLTVPVGGIEGVDRSLNVVSVEINEIPSADLGTLYAGGPNVAQIEILDGESGKPILDTEIKEIQISLAYDTTALTAEAIRSGNAPIYRADSACALADGLFTIVPPDPDIINVANGMVTFSATTTGAFAIGTFCDLNPTFTPTTAIVNQARTFSFQGDTADIASFSWDLGGDGEDGTGPTFQTTFDSVGTFPLTLTVESASNGCFRSVTLPVTVSSAPDPDPGPGPTPSNPPIPDFTVEGFENEDEVEITAGTIIQFVDESFLANSYAWDFGDEESDENTSTLENPTHAYNENVEAEYDVTLRATNFDGTRTEEKIDYILVKPLVAAFEAVPETGTAPLTVTFEDTTNILGTPDGDPILPDENEVTREWTMIGPDGTSEVIGNGQENFEMPLSEAGTYTVRLVVNNNEVTDDVERELVYDGDGIVLEADFDVSVVDCVATFTNLSTGPFGPVIWAFDDGTFSEEEEPVHTYAANGSYDVVLTIATTDGAQDDITRTVNIVSCGSIAPTVTTDFNASVNGLTVSFTDASTSNPPGLIDTWTWSFGDGQTSTDQNPTHTYQAEGTFTVTLVASISGTTISSQRTLTVQVSEGGTGGIEFVNPPAGIEPIDIIDVGLMPFLVVGPFSDPENVYSATQYEIAFDESFAEQFVVWRETKSGTDDDFRFEIPEFILENGPAIYYWRARFVDADGRTSDWAGPYMFTTVAVDPEDADDDGVPDNEEVDDPLAIFPGLDPNNPMVLYVRAAMGDGYWALEGLDNVVELISLKAFTVEEGGVALPPNTEMPLGLIGYKLATVNPGDEAKVRVHFNPAAPENSAWFAFLGVEGWQEFSGSTAVFGDGMATVMLTLQDGGFGDLDGIENGIIIVPLSGFGVVEAVIIDDGGSGSDTCFISAATEKPWAAVVLMTLVAAAGLLLRRSPIR